jgi:hypothetical protein
VSVLVIDCYWCGFGGTNIIQLVKSYTGAQTAVENMIMVVDDDACNSSIATHT